ncbi:MAG: sigma factor-like helix-turn-helix DNA-binding protein [Candidatus Binatia bacterium]
MDRERHILTDPYHHEFQAVNGERPLDSREKQVLRLRFANDEQRRTHEELAELLGVPVETVRHIERQALRKLRLSALGPVGCGFDGWDEV